MFKIIHWNLDEEVSHWEDNKRHGLYKRLVKKTNTTFESQWHTNWPGAEFRTRMAGMRVAIREVWEDAREELVAGGPAGLGAFVWPAEADTVEWNLPHGGGLSAQDLADLDNDDAATAATAPVGTEAEGFSNHTAPEYAATAAAAAARPAPAKLPPMAPLMRRFGSTGALSELGRRGSPGSDLGALESGGALGNAPSPSGADLPRSPTPRRPDGMLRSKSVASYNAAMLFQKKRGDGREGPKGPILRRRQRSVNNVKALFK
uniref:Uncharacterized protein n=2 Tax=Heterosigma akashiwo TaxID=2829 RepID=A0A7S4D5X3_HETAK